MTVMDSLQLSETLLSSGMLNNAQHDIIYNILHTATITTIILLFFLT